MSQGRQKDREFTIREAVLDDLPKIIDLACEMVSLSKSHLRPEVLDSEVRRVRRANFEQLPMALEMPEGGVFVAVDKEGTHLGHILVLGNNIDPVADLGQAWIYDVSVIKPWWGRGVGRALMGRAESFTESLGLEWIGLGVTVANARAVGFYEELGYEIERVQMIKRLEQPRQV